MGESSKRCAWCKRDLPLSEFFHCTANKDGYFTHCKDCDAERVGRKRKPILPPVPEGFARCTLCGQVLPFDSFGKCKAKKSGLYSWCKACASAKGKENRRNNPERYRQRAKEKYQRTKQQQLQKHKQWYKKNRTEVLERCRAYAKANRGTILQRSRKYWAEKCTTPEYRKARSEKAKQRYTDNLDEARKAARDRARNYRSKNRDKHNAKQREWRNANPDKAISYIHRRLARKRSLPDNFTPDDWNKALEYFHGCCAYCGNQQGLLPGTELTADHFIPLSSSNCPGTIPENMLPACCSCNTSKNNRDAETWLIQRFGKRKARDILKRIADYFESLKG